MKHLYRLLAVASAAFFIAGNASAQTVTNHAYAIGKGPGVTGYTSLLCGSAQLAVGQAAADPICQTITGDVTISAAGVTAIGATKVLNSMLATMAANTTKCNATVGVAVPTDCTAATMRTNIGVVIGTNVQAWDADLDCLAAISTNGILARTGAGTCAVRTVTAPAAGITITNGDGVAGNPTLVLANDLAALEGLAGTGFATRTATDAWAQRTLQAPAAGLTITNPAGVAGDPTFALANDLGALEGLSGTGIARRTGTDTWSVGTAVSNAELATAADGTIKSNISGATATPSDNTITTVLDKQFGTTQGSVIYRNATQWVALAPSTAGQFLTTQGPAANPTWSGGGAGTGTVTSIVCGNQTITASGTCQTDSGLGVQNCSLGAAVASNLLTINLLDASGATPTSTSSCRINFRSATANSGVVTSNYTTGALSISTFAVGATLGTSNNIAFRLWVCAFDNAGTTVLALFNASNATSIFPLNETLVASTTGISATATSAGVFYTPNGTALASKAFRILGYIEYNSTGLATAGTYATAPNFIQLFGPGVRRPGEVVQQVLASTTTSTTTTLATYVDTNLTQALTPTSAANVVIAQASGNGQHNTASAGIWARVIRDLVPLQGETLGQNNAGAPNTISFVVGGVDKTNTTSSVTYKLQVRCNLGGNTIVVPVVGTNTLLLQEIMG